MEGQARSLDEDSLLKMFRQDIAKIPLLTREEESALAFNAKAGDIDARDRLVTSNLKWVFKIARDMWQPGLPLMDMISEGCIGLCQAAKAFDPELGFRLTTFSERKIRWRIISFILSYKKHCLDSLDDEAFDDGENTRKDLLISDEIGADRICFYSDIESLLDRLTDREKSVLSLRFWEDKSLDEIGTLLAMSRSRVGLIEARALRKIRWSTYGEPAAHEAYALS